MTGPGLRSTRRSALSDAQPSAHVDRPSAWTPEPDRGSRAAPWPGSLLPTLPVLAASKRNMRHGIKWFLVVMTLALAPSVVQAWEHGPRIERQRLHAAFRRGWCETLRETHRAIAQA